MVQRAAKVLLRAVLLYWPELFDVKDAVDFAVVAEILKVIKPAGVEAAQKAWEEYQRENDDVI